MSNALYLRYGQLPFTVGERVTMLFSPDLQFELGELCANILLGSSLNGRLCVFNLFKVLSLHCMEHNLGVKHC